LPECSASEDAARAIAALYGRSALRPGRGRPLDRPLKRMFGNSVLESPTALRRGGSSRCSSARPPPRILRLISIDKEVKQFIAEMVKSTAHPQELSRVFGKGSFSRDHQSDGAARRDRARLLAGIRALFLSPQRIERACSSEPQRRAARAALPPNSASRRDHRGIIGVETTYGRNIGTYRVIDACRRSRSTIRSVPRFFGTSWKAT